MRTAPERQWATHRSGRADAGIRGTVRQGRSLPFGSVKSNIGHLDTAAGVAGVIKVALALEHGEIPPSINFEANNPSIEFTGSPFAVASRLTAWTRREAPRYAAVNSLGVGGTNAFVVLEEAPARDRQTAGEIRRADRIFGALAPGTDDYAAKLAAWVRDNPDASLAQVAATLGLGGRCSSTDACWRPSLVEAAGLLEQGDARRVYSHAGI